MQSLHMGTNLPPFAFEGLDRLELERARDDLVISRQASGVARYIPIWRGQILVNHTRDAMVTLDQPPLNVSKGGSAGGSVDAPILLGDAGGHSYFAIEVSSMPPSTPSTSSMPEPKTGPVLTPNGQFVQPRAIAPGLSAFDMGMTALALHFTAWDKRSRYCGRCGSPTQPRQGGVSRACTRDTCSELLFPRVNPAVIMLIRDEADRRIVLGKAPHLPENMATVLAGYLSPGETLVQAVKRETMEEVGIQVRDVDYYGSQPWAYSGSLMVGFSSIAQSTQLTVNLDELSHAAWYSRDDIHRLTASGEIMLPNRFSIARMMIDAWVQAVATP